MALEIEYEDYGPEEIDINQVEVDPAAMINGDGDPRPPRTDPRPELRAYTEPPADESENQSSTLVVTEPDGTSAPLLEAVAETISQGNVSQGVDATPTNSMAPSHWHIHQVNHTRPAPPSWMLEDAAQIAEWNQQCSLAESNFKIQVDAAKESHTTLAVKRAELEAELKDLKADEKTALKSLSNMIQRGPIYPQPKSKIDEAVATGGEAPSAIVNDQADNPNADETWRDIPMAKLLEGIKGLGPKKAEAILDLTPTIVAWEELRAKAGKAFKQVSEVLPKGIGSNIADEIEERVFNAMREHQKGLEQSKAGQANQVSQVEEATNKATSDSAS